MKKRLISVLLVVCMLISMLPVGSAFAADTKAESTKTVVRASDATTSEGEDTTEASSDSSQPEESTEPTESTKPEEPEDPPVTRAQWLQMLVQVFEMTVEDDNLPDNYFSDLTGEEAYYRDILVAVEFGVVNIAAGNPFEPEKPVTREFAAQTLNYCLGFQLGTDSTFTYQEAAEVSDPEALQVGINRGWFTVEDEKVSPLREVTSSEMAFMKADAEAILAAQDETSFEENSATISENVKEIPMGTEVGIDALGNLTVKDCPVTISSGDFFVAYYGELPVAMKALSVSEKDGVTTIAFTTDGTDDILSDVQFSGSLDVNLEDFIPDSETRTRVVDGEILTESPATRTIKFDNDSMKLEVKKDIKLTNGLKINIKYELENIDLDYAVDQKSSTSKLVFRGDNDITISVKGEALPALNDGESWTLGYFPILFGLARLELTAEFGVEGEISATIGGSMGIGYTYNKTDGFRIVKEFQKNKFDCVAKLSASIGVKAKLGFDYLVTSADLYASFGVKGKLTDTRHLDSDTVKHCEDIAVYMYLKGGVEAKIFLLPKWQYEEDIWDEDSSLLRLHYHIEDGLIVDACTMGVSESDYYTGTDSKYYNPSLTNSGSTYTGSNGETVTLWSYTLNSDNEATITKYNGTASTLTIPAYIDGYPVVAFGGWSSAFAKPSSIRSVYISNGITSIGSYAFQSCSNLSSISIPNSVTSIGGSSFKGCSSLTEIELTASDVNIDRYAFQNCTSLENVSVPDSAVFGGGSGTKCDFFVGDSIILTITKDTGVISDGFLYANNQYSNSYYAQRGIKKIIVSEGITEIGDNAFANLYYDSSATLQEIVLPSTITKIGANAFYRSNISSITMPTGDPDIVSTIGYSAFEGCSKLKTIAIPEGVVTLSYSMFKSCTSLESVSLPSTLVTIGSSAFSGCSSLPECKLPRGVATIESSAFYNCAGLKEFEFTADMTSISDSCFYGCKSLTEIYVPTAITSIGRNAFDECTALQNISIADSTSFYGANSSNAYSFFAGDQVTLHVRCVNGEIPAKWLQNKMSGIAGLVLEDGITTIGANAFYSTKSTQVLKQVTLPETLISLGTYAFYDCSALETINLPSQLTSIPAYCFYGCAAMKSIEIHDRIMNIGNSAFRGAGLETAVVPNSVTEMGTYVFASCPNLASVTLPTARRKIEDGTFYNCPALTSITLPRLVDTIGESAFEKCTGLTEISWSERITTLGSKAFRGCSSLQAIHIPETVTSIGTYAFADCTALTEITLPENTTSLANYLFSGCTALQTYTVPVNVTAIGNSVFAECSALENVTLPPALQTMGEKAFYNCDCLQSIVIPDGTKTIGAQCFYDCDGLLSLALPNSVTSIGSYLCYSSDKLASVCLSEGLTAIPEAAFMDCAELDNVVISRRVTTIGSNAFNVCPSLLKIVIPAGVTSIAGNSLSYPDRTVIYGRNGSYAQTYADEYGYEFVAHEVNALAVTLSESNLSIPKGKTVLLVAAVDPADYTDDITWKSTNTSVVTVSDDGLVTAVGVGTATVRIVIGDVSASCKITVIEPVTRITLNKTALTMDAQETQTLTVTIKPTNATIQAVQWSSSNEAVATVDENGVVTAVGKGTAKITASATDGSGISASCTVTVTGDYIIAESIVELQSSHPYKNNSKDFWCYTVSDAEKLFVSFSELTTVEEESDFIYLYDGDGNLIGSYTGDALAGKTVEIPGDTIVISLVSDTSYSEYGFAVTDVKTVEPPHVHTYGEWSLTKEPSCTEKGTEARVCTTCGENDNREVAALGHAYVEKTAAPTCTEQGYTLHTCSRCADSYRDTYTEALRHSFADGICSRCGIADPTYEAASLLIYADSVTALPGETVRIPVMISGGAEFAGFTMTIVTSSGVTLKNIEKGELLNGSDGALTKNIAQGQVNWNCATATVGTGELLVLTVELNDTAKEETITIRLKENKSTNIVDVNGNAITTRFEDIRIDAQAVVYGDINGDGEIDTSDAVRLVRYLVDLAELSDSEKRAADVNGDGDITSADSIKLVRYLVGLVESLDSVPTRGVSHCVEGGEVKVAMVTGKVGDTVTVPVEIAENPGFAGFTLELSYPAELELLDIEKGDVLKNAGGGSLTVNKNLINWNNSENTYEDGELLILTFRISAAASDGNYSVSIEPKESKESNFASEDGRAVRAAFTAGNVRFIAETSDVSQECPGAAFADMPGAGYWSHEAIDWAITAGVTYGTSATLFSPQKECTRAETVTFIWRAVGSPEPSEKECRFVDVDADAYYAKAVLWALENGITTGVSETAFRPDDVCSRAEIVTFLWRLSGSPNAAGAHEFADVDRNSYYEQAVAWAATESITNGIHKTLFGADAICTREQIVTFLYRTQK